MSHILGGYWCKNCAKRISKNDIPKVSGKRDVPPYEVPVEDGLGGQSGTEDAGMPEQSQKG